MPLILKDRVKETTTTNSTGAITLLGAATGYQSFSAIGSGNTTYYVIASQAATEWEVGVGTYTSPNQLSRDTVLSSSNAGSKVNFSAGIKDVFVAQPSGEAIYVNQATNKVELLGNATTSISFSNVTADLYTGNGSAISAINASNISSGTIANARTTASSANGASTIVARDAGGNFSANTVTAAVIGDLSGGSAINASNISSGTIANARTTASSSNGASTIVLRDASGNFTANAGTFTSVSGNGVGLTAINASNISSGTIGNSFTTAASANGANTIVSRDANGSFSANVGTFTSISGNGSALTAINASNITSGTIDNARTTASTSNGANTIVLRSASGNFAANEISGEEVIATNGLFVNNRTVGTSYSIPSGYSAVSTGPVTLSNGVSVTVPSGGKWVVL